MKMCSSCASQSGSQSEWSKRYDEINDFERMLTQNHVRILKFFLHMSPRHVRAAIRRKGGIKRSVDDPYPKGRELTR